MPGLSGHEADGAEARGCWHIAELSLVRPRWAECRQCRVKGDDWVELWLCLSCGWVACSDDSPNRHARAHHEETDHPVCVAFGSGSRGRWCHVH